MQHARPAHRLTLKLLAAFRLGTTVLTNIFGLARPRERHVEALAWLARLKQKARDQDFWNGCVEHPIVSALRE
jgi:hypothetical protein